MGVAAVVALTVTLVAPIASAQTVADIEARDALIANQEALLNVYRCMFDVDTEIVPGGCTGGKPTLPAADPHPFTGTPTDEELTARDNLIGNQEALLNVYRCLFDIDTQIVPGGCVDGKPNTGEVEAVPRRWYRDPTCRNAWRWWDGQQWTDAVDNNGVRGIDPLQNDEKNMPSPVEGETPDCEGYDGTSDNPPIAYVAAGWFPDPTCRYTSRWWSGYWWTDHVIDQGERGNDPLPEGDNSLPPPVEGETSDCGESNNAITPSLFRDIAVAEFHTCGVRIGGAIDCWGDNTWGQSEPPEGEFASITVADTIGCGIRIDQTLACWGARLNSSRAGPGGIRVDIPTDLSGRFTDVIVRGDRTPSWYVTNAYACAIRVDQTISCWGVSETRQGDPPGGTFTAISKSYTLNSWCAIRTDQSVACWGGNSRGQADPPEGEFTAVETASTYSCGIRAEVQTIACWGGKPDEYSGGQEPLITPPEGRFTAISADSGYACGIKTDQSLSCWGYDHSGRADPPEGEFTAISTSRHYACGIKADQSLSCWGSNKYERADPPEGKFATIATSDFHACGIKTDGTAACWGSNLHGKVDPTRDQRPQIAAGLG